MVIEPATSEQRILEAMRCGNSNVMTPSEVSRLSGVSYTEVRNMLERMSLYGSVEKVRAGKHALAQRYRIG